MASDLTGMGRFSEPGLLILASLAAGEKHGYAMLQDIKGIYGLEMGAGTLYAAIARLEKRGLIEALDTQDRRRPYRLTAAGESALREQLTTLKAFVATGLERLGAS